MALLDPRKIRALANEIGLRPTKQRGQNFVTDANTVRRIVALAEVGSDDHVIEVGPGLGSLTLGLLEAGAAVSAIEIEDILATRLPKTVGELAPEASDRLRVINQDALLVERLPARTAGEHELFDRPPTAVVANLPYNVSVPVLLHLLAIFPSWQRGLVMVQLEVADRLVAEPGSKIYGVPSVKRAWFADAQRVGTVPPTVFWPVPNVDSGLVALHRHEPPSSAVSRELVFEVVDAAFGQRRKMLRQALAGLIGSAAEASEVISQAGVDPTWRGEKLQVQDFVAIAEQIAKNRE